MAGPEPDMRRATSLLSGAPLFLFAFGPYAYSLGLLVSADIWDNLEVLVVDRPNLGGSIVCLCLDCPAEL